MEKAIECSHETLVAADHPERGAIMDEHADEPTGPPPDVPVGLGEDAGTQARGRS